MSSAGINNGNRLSRFNAAFLDGLASLGRRINGVFNRAREEPVTVVSVVRRDDSSGNTNTSLVGVVSSTDQNSEPSSSSGHSGPVLTALNNSDKSCKAAAAALKLFKEAVENAALELQLDAIQVEQVKEQIEHTRRAAKHLIKIKTVVNSGKTNLEKATKIQKLTGMSVDFNSVSPSVFLESMTQVIFISLGNADKWIAAPKALVNRFGPDDPCFNGFIRNFMKHESSSLLSATPTQEAHKVLSDEEAKVYLTALLQEFLEQIPPEQQTKETFSAWLAQNETRIACITQSCKQDFLIYAEMELGVFAEPEDIEDDTRL